MWVTSEEAARLEGKKPISIRQAIYRSHERFKVKYEKACDIKKMMIAVSSLSASAQAKFWEEQRIKQNNEVAGVRSPSPASADKKERLSAYSAAPGGRATSPDYNTTGTAGRQSELLFSNPDDKSALDEANDRYRLIEEALNGGWKKFKGQTLTAGVNGDRKVILIAQLDDYFDFVGRKNGFSKTTIWRWYTGFKREGLGALMREKRRDSGSCRTITEPMAKIIRALWLGPEQRSIREIHRELMAAGFPRVSLDTLARWIGNEANINPCESALARRGEKFFKDHHEKFTLRTFTDLRPNDIWFGDHHEFDLFVRDDRGELYRPWITAWLDAKSRAVVGYHICRQPNSDTIATALRHAILPKKYAKADHYPMRGKPHSVYIDNGKDYWARILTGERRHLGKVTLDESTCGLIRALCIEMRHAIPYNARAKTIERWFGTCEDMLIRQLPGACGNSPGRRPERLKEELKVHQAWQKIRELTKPSRFGSILSAKEQHLIAEFDGDSPFLTEREFIDLFEGWLTGNYHKMVISGKDVAGRTPDLVWTQDVVRIEMVAGGERILDALLHHQEYRVVQQAGIEMFGSQGERRFYEADVLWERGLIGQRVLVLYDPNDISEIQVYHDGRFLATATNRKLISMKIEDGMLTSSADVKAAIREQRKRLRQIESSIQFVQDEAKLPDPVERFKRAAAQRFDEVEALPIAVGAEVEVFPADAIARQEMMRTAALNNKRSTQPRVIEAVEMPHAESEEPIITRRDAWADLE